MNLDLVETNELAKHSNGGTELLQRRLYSGAVPRELLEKTQIVFSRVRELKEDKKRVYYAHDLPEDPEASRFSDPMFRKKFDAFVFVSNWQLEKFNMVRGVEYDRSIVIRNSIEPLSFDYGEKDDVIRLVYTPTPHRGLELLVPVFIELAKYDPKIELHVYSSFKLYGWEERDAAYQELFEICKAHTQIIYHGSVSNEELRGALPTYDIFAYPSIWKETSCLCLIEAMSAGLLCVHSNLAALPETSLSHTMMYGYSADKTKHAHDFYHVLKQAIEFTRADRAAGLDDLGNQLYFQKVHTDRVYNWTDRAKEWTALLQSIS
jgi:UDP-glucose:(glucosyl)LPS alpha-1,2-glucosyltransferase